jgi:hypothetical protein
VHRLTIATALAGALAFTVWALTERRPAAALGGAAAAAGIAFYLRNLRARLDRKLSPHR